jgi:uncharacterized protein (TIGR03083 family)
MAELPDWLAALRAAQDRLAATAAGIGPDRLALRSYADEWTVAEVAGHLGGQVEIFELFRTAGRTGGDPPDDDALVAVRDRWNGLRPARQLADGVAAAERLVAWLEEVPESEAFRLTLFGVELDLAALVALRLAELVLHTWDIAVALDPAATLPPDAVELLVDTLPRRAAAAGTPVPGGRPVEIVTTDPPRTYRVELEPAVRLTPRDEVTPDATVLRMPAEAFLRLIAGRLDPQHTPLGVDTGPELDQLRQAFPGF